MNIILSLILSVMLGVSAAPSNPVIAEFINVTNEQSAVTGMSASYETTFLGEAVVVSQSVPVDSSVFSQIPTGPLKEEFIKELMSDEDTKGFVDVLKESNINLILRLVATDGNSCDVIVTPADL